MFVSFKITPEMSRGKIAVNRDSWTRDSRRPGLGVNWLAKVWAAVRNCIRR